MIRPYRSMHSLKIRISIPKELQELKLSKLKTSGEDFNELAVKKPAQYSDAEVHLRILQMGNNAGSKGPAEADSDSDSDPFLTGPDDRALPVPKSIQNRQNPISLRIDALADYLSGKRSSKYLPSRFIAKRKLVPYNELCQIESNDKARLSVTKILPHAYCELRDMYQLYLGGIRVETKAMKDGRKVHQILEEQTHPQIDLYLETQSGDEEIVKIDKSTDLYDIKTDKQKIDSHRSDTQFESDVISVNARKITGKEILVETESLDTEEKRMKYLKEKYSIEDIDSEEDTKHSVISSDHLLTEIKHTQTFQAEKIDVGTEEAAKAVDGNLIIMKLLDTGLILRSQVHKIAQTVRRLINLFEFGRGREVLVHGLYNRKEEKLLTKLPAGGEIHSDDYIIISGVIDDLYLTSDHEDAFKAFQKELQDELKEAYDFEETFRAIRAKTKQWTDINDPMLYLIVNDDKSRSDKRRPSLTYQKTQLLQVGMYRRFLGLLSEDVNFTYESWRFNMESRHESLDSPMDNTLVSFSYFVNHYLLNDFIKLKRGEPLEFTGILRPPLQSAEKLDKPYFFENTTNVKQLDVLEGEWVNPPTFAHIIGRLAQTQCLLNDFLSDKLQVSYINRTDGHCLGTITQQYDEKYVSKQMGEGMELWLGKREPSSTNYEQACNYCDFKEKCQIPDRRKGLL